MPLKHRKPPLCSSSLRSSREPWGPRAPISTSIRWLSHCHTEKESCSFWANHERTLRRYYLWWFGSTGSCLFFLFLFFFYERLTVGASGVCVFYKPVLQVSFARVGLLLGASYPRDYPRQAQTVIFPSWWRSLITSSCLLMRWSILQRARVIDQAPDWRTSWV